MKRRTTLATVTALALLFGGCGVFGDAAPTCAAVLPTWSELHDETAPVATGWDDNFAVDGALNGYTVNKPEALPDVAVADGRYRATMTDNTGDRTLHFHAAQGRIDAVVATFPFEVVVTNVGIGTVADSQVAPEPIGDETFVFAGIQIHDLDLDAANSSHVVVGHRGWAPFTIEGKHTCAGESWVSDEDTNAAPTGRMDLRVVGTAERQLEVYHRPPGSSAEWTPYRGDGEIPGPIPAYAEQVYVGLITSAQGSLGLPYVGTADRFEVRPG